MSDTEAELREQAEMTLLEVWSAMQDGKGEGIPASEARPDCVSVIREALRRAYERGHQEGRVSAVFDAINLACHLCGQGVGTYEHPDFGYLIHDGDVTCEADHLRDLLPADSRGETQPTSDGPVWNRITRIEERLERVEWALDVEHKLGLMEKSMSSRAAPTEPPRNQEDDDGSA